MGSCTECKMSPDGNHAQGCPFHRQQVVGWICPRCGKANAPWAAGCLENCHILLRLSDKTTEEGKA